MQKIKNQKTDWNIDWKAIKSEGYLSPRSISLRLNRLSEQMVMVSCELTQMQLSIEKFYIGADDEK